MTAEGSPRHRASPLLRMLRLWERRARRGILATPDQVSSWRAAVPAAQSEGAGERSEMLLRLTSIEAARLDDSISGADGGRTGPGFPSPDARLRRALAQLWQDLGDCGARGRLRSQAAAVATRLARIEAVIGQPPLTASQQQTGRRGSIALAPARRPRPVASLESPRALPLTLTGELPPTLAGELEFLRQRDDLIAGFLRQLNTPAAIPLPPGAYPLLAMPLFITTEIQVDWPEDEPDPWTDGPVIAQTQDAARVLIRRGAKVVLIRGRPVSPSATASMRALAPQSLSVDGAVGPVALDSLPLFDQALPVERRPGFLRVILAAGAGPAAARQAPSSTRLPDDNAEIGADQSAIPFPSSARMGARAPASRIGVSDPWPDAASPLLLSAAMERGEPPFTPSHGKRGVAAPRIPRHPAFESEPSSGLPGADGESVGGPMEIILDWVSGEDPWQRPDEVERAAAMVRSLGGGEEAQLVRGREVPFEQYDPGRAQAAADLVASGPRGPVPLTSVDLLDRAIIQAARPSALRLLVAPASARRAVTTPPLSRPASATDFATPSFPELIYPAEPLALEEARDSGSPAIVSTIGSPQSEVTYRAAIRFGADPAAASRSPVLTVEPAGGSGFGVAARGEEARPLGSGVIARLSLGRSVRPGLIPHRAFGPRRGLVPVLRDHGSLRQSEISPVPQSRAARSDGEGASGDFLEHRSADQDLERIGATRGRAAAEVGKQGEIEPITLTVDWVSGDDPWREPTRLERALEGLQRLIQVGLRIELVRGREVPIEQYDPIQGRRAADFNLVTTAGPISLEHVDLLESAMLVAQRPGGLQVLLAPSHGQGREGQLASVAPGASRARTRELGDFPLVLASSSPEVEQGEGLSVTTAPGVAAPGLAIESLGPARSRPGPVGQRVEITLNWIGGADPWAAGEVRERMREAGQALKTRGAEVVFRRGREVPSARYDAGAAQRSSDFRVMGPAGPISLGSVDLLDRAVLVSRRPGAFEVILAPSPIEALARRSIAQPRLPLPVAPPQAGWDDFGPTEGTRRQIAPALIQIVTDWIAGRDPWSTSIPLLPPRAVEQFARQGIRLEIVRGRAIAAEQYDAGQARSAEELIVFGSGGPVSLGALPWLDHAVVQSQRPGRLHLLVAPTSGGAAKAPPALAQPLARAESRGPELAGTGLSERFEIAEGWLAERARLVEPPTGPGPADTVPMAAAEGRPAEFVASSTWGLTEPRISPAPSRSTPAEVTPRSSQARPAAVGSSPEVSQGGAGIALQSGLGRSSRPGLAESSAFPWPLPLLGAPSLSAPLIARSGIEGTFETPEPSGAPKGVAGAPHRVESADMTPLSVLVFDVAAEPAAQPHRGGWPERVFPSGPGSQITWIGNRAVDRGGREGDRVEAAAALTGYQIPSTLIFLSDDAGSARPQRQSLARARIDREMGVPAETATTVAASAVEPGSGSRPATPGPNLDALARDVYQQIKWRLALERERVGAQRHPRVW